MDQVDSLEHETWLAPNYSIQTVTPTAAKAL